MSDGAEAELPSEPILRLEPGMHGAPIKRIDVDAEGQFVVSGSDDKTVRVWALDDGRPLATMRVPIGEGNVGKVYAVAISPDGERIAAGGWGPASDGLSNSIYIFERASGRIVQRIDGLPEVIRHLAFAPDGRHLVAGLSANGIRVYETAGFREVAADRDYGGGSYSAAFDGEGRLVTSSEDGRVRLYDADFNLSKSEPAPSGEPFGVAFSPDGAQIAVGYFDGTRVDVLDGHTLEPLFEANTTGVDKGDLYAMIWSADGRYLYAGGRWQRDGRHLVRRWPDRGRGAYEDIALSRNAIIGLRPLANGGLAFGAADPTLGVLSPGGEILWSQEPAQADFRGQEEVLAVGVKGERVRFGFWLDPDAEFDVAARRLTLDPESDPNLVTARTEAPGLDIEDWENEYTPTLNGEGLPLQQYEMSRSLAIAPDGARFLLGADWSLRLFDRSGEQLWKEPVPGVAWAVNIAGDGRLAIAAFGDGTIRWYRLEDGAELLAFFPHADRERWVVWTPQGYYMASPGGEALIGWHVNRALDTPEFYSAGLFRDRFHRPDVVALVLEELDVQKALARADAEAGVAAVTPSSEEVKEHLVSTLPPLIEITAPTEGAEITGDRLEVAYRIRRPVGGPVPAVSAHLNGRLVQTVVGPPIKIPEAGYSGAMTLPLAGWLDDHEATLALIAEGEHRASDPVAVKVRVGAAPTAAKVKPRLFVLAIGVSLYERHPPEDLAYAAKDATDVVEFLKRQEGGLYREVKIMALLNHDAVASAIIGGLRWLREQVDEHDVVLVFLSGHGAVEGLEYFYLPHDADVRTQDDLSVTAVRQDQLRSGLRALYRKGAKVLAFFDTCHAGATFGGTRDLPADIDRLAEVLGSPEGGVIVFTSSTGREYSVEKPEWENGAFTEALLEALAGAAARQGQSYISVSDLQAFLPKRVKALTDGAQNPRIYVPFEEMWEAPIAVVLH